MYVIRTLPSWLLLLVSVGLLPLLAGCGEGSAENSTADREENRTRVETLVLDPQQFEDVVEVTGSVEALDDAALSAQTNGTLVYVADLGTRVSEDSIVAQVNPRSARAAVEQAQAQLASAQAQHELAQDTYERQEPLYRDSIISPSEFQNVRSQRTQALASLNQARANLSQAEEQLANTRITAPFTGTVEERLAERGEQVSPGQQVVRLVNTERVRVQAGVPERYANDLERGDSVQVRIQSAALADRTGRIVFVGNTVDPASRTFSIEVEIDNAERRLKPEMVAKLFVVRERLDDVLVVPRSAISRDEDGLGAYTVARTDSGAVVRSHRVTAGPATGNQMVIESGLDPDDELITVGRTEVAEGDRIEVVGQHTDVEDAAPSNAPTEDTAAVPQPAPTDGENAAPATP